MPYVSRAAKVRARRRAQWILVRNYLIFWVGIVIGGMLGIALGLLILHYTLPDHPFFEHFQIWKGAP